MVRQSVFVTFIMVALMEQSDNWHWSLFDALSKEEQEAQVKELLAEVEAWEAEMMAEMDAENGPAKKEEQ